MTVDEFRDLGVKAAYGFREFKTIAKDMATFIKLVKAEAKKQEIAKYLIIKDNYLYVTDSYKAIGLNLTPEHEIANDGFAYDLVEVLKAIDNAGEMLVDTQGKLYTSRDGEVTVVEPVEGVTLPSMKHILAYAEAGDHVEVECEAFEKSVHWDMITAAKDVVTYPSLIEVEYGKAWLKTYVGGLTVGQALGIPNKEWEFTPKINRLWLRKILATIGSDFTMLVARNNEAITIKTENSWWAVIMPIARDKDMEEIK